MIPHRDKGAALLTILLIVAVMAVVSAGALERLTLATRLSASAAAGAQAREAALAAEAVALARLQPFVAAKRVPVEALARPIDVPLPGGSAKITLSDVGNCFNLNSLATETGQPNPEAGAQLIAIATALGIPHGDAERLMARATDAIDADSLTSVDGAEDGGGGEPAYLAANAPMVDVGELAALPGVGAALASRLDGQVCALPTSEPAPLNVNTLTPAQAPLLAARLGGEGALARAQALLASRPVGGWATLTQLRQSPALAGGFVPQGLAVETRLYGLRSEARIGDAVRVSEALIDTAPLQPVAAGPGTAAPAPLPPFARVVRRRWPSAL